MDINANADSFATNLNAGFDEKRRITLSKTATFTFGAEQKIESDASLQFPYKVRKYNMLFNMHMYIISCFQLCNVFLLRIWLNISPHTFKLFIVYEYYK